MLTTAAPATATAAVVAVAMPASDAGLRCRAAMAALTAAAALPEADLRH